MITEDKVSVIQPVNNQYIRNVIHTYNRNPQPTTTFESVMKSMVVDYLKKYKNIDI